MGAPTPAAPHSHSGLRFRNPLPAEVKVTLSRVLVSMVAVAHTPGEAAGSFLRVGKPAVASVPTDKRRGTAPTARATDIRR